MRVTSLTYDQREVFVAALGDIPQTLVSRYLIRAGRAQAWFVGAVDDFSAAVVQWHGMADEPMGFGDDAAALHAILSHVEGWACINVPPTLADALEALLQRNSAIKRYGDIFYTLTQPVTAPAFHADEVTVRLLTPDDAPLLETAPRELSYADWSLSAAEALRLFSIACGIATSDGAPQIVAIAQELAHTPTYAEIGVATDEAYRKRGLSTQASRLVCQQIQAQGRTPVWSTGEDNRGSQRVAEKLGFVEVARRVYLIPQEE